MTIQLYRGASGFWWVLKSRNGRTVATSEVYQRRVGAERAIEALQFSRCKAWPVVDCTGGRK